MVATREGSVTGKIREALAAGEALTANQAAERFGVSLGMLGLVIRSMEKEGYRIGTRTAPEPNPTGRTERYLVSAPTDSHANGNGNGKAPAKAAKTAKPRKTAKKAKQATKRTGAAAEIRRRLGAGDWVNAQELAADLGCTTSALAQVMRSMKSDGTRFASEVRGMRTYYRVANASAPVKPTKRTAKRATKTTRAAVRRAGKVRTARPAATPPGVAPTVGSHLLVKAHLLDDKGGSPSLWLLDEAGNTWACEVEALLLLNA